ncbi:MAG: hypothetical protein FWE53_04175 [Firmicutes bacterium]|nr:hypothetical protein [Bacillota bacterium]
MKTIFYRHGIDNAYVFAMIPIIIGVMSAVFFRKFILIEFVAVLIIPLTMSFLLFVVAMKRSLSKIYISEQGLEHRFFKKQLKFIGWDEIQLIGKHSQYISIFDKRNLKLILKNKNTGNLEMFYFNCSNKIRKTLIELCPVEEIKTQLEQIEFRFLTDIFYKNRKNGQRDGGHGQGDGSNDTKA